MYSRGPWLCYCLPYVVDDFIGSPETVVQGDEAAACDRGPWGVLEAIIVSGGAWPFILAGGRRSAVMVCR